MKNTQNDGLTLNLEDKIKGLIVEMGHDKCIKPNGKLDDTFILNYLTQNNKRAAKDYLQVVSAYDKLKKDDLFIKEINPKVSKETLNKIQLFGEHLVRPIIYDGIYKQDAIHTGVIIKLPEKSNANQYADGESWKALIEKERLFKVGDKVLYGHSGPGSNLILDNEVLHLVCFFIGKIKE